MILPGFTACVGEGAIRESDPEINSPRRGTATKMGYDVFVTFVASVVFAHSTL